MIIVWCWWCCLRFFSRFFFYLLFVSLTHEKAFDSIKCPTMRMQSNWWTIKILVIYVEFREFTHSRYFIYFLFFFSFSFCWWYWWCCCCWLRIVWMGENLKKVFRPNSENGIFDSEKYFSNCAGVSYSFSHRIFSLSKA